MVTSTYNPCLLVSTKEFRVVRIQTDDILILASPAFAKLEDSELQKAKLTIKPRDTLSLESKLIFNGCVLSVDLDDTIHLIQKGQGQKLQQITIKSENLQQEYIKQRVRGIYIASIY